MAYVLRNHSANYLSNLDLNSEFLSRPSEYPTKRINISLHVKLNIPELIAQSIVFSNELFSYGSIDYRRVFSERYDDRARDKATRLYIYSYYKCLFIGSRFNLIQNKLPDSTAFIGHAVFCRLLVEQNFVFESNDHKIYVSFDFQKDEVQTLLDSLEENFPFLKATKSLSANNDEFIFSSDFDACLSRLDEHIKKSNKSDLLLIKKINDQSIIDLCKSSDNPIINGLYGSSSSIFHYVPSAYSVSSDLSYFLSRANFVHLRSISGVTSDINYYFTSVELNDSLHLVTHDVRSITYIMPKFIGQKEEISRLSVKLFNIDVFDYKEEFSKPVSEKYKPTKSFKTSEGVDPK